MACHPRCGGNFGGPWCRCTRTGRGAWRVARDSTGRVGALCLHRSFASFAIRKRGKYSRGRRIWLASQHWPARFWFGSQCPHYVNGGRCAYCPSTVLSSGGLLFSFNCENGICRGLKGEQPDCIWSADGRWRNQSGHATSGRPVRNIVPLRAQQFWRALAPFEASPRVANEQGDVVEPRGGDSIGE